MQAIVKNIHLNHLAGRAYSCQYFSSPKMCKEHKETAKIVQSISAFQPTPEILGSALLTFGAGYWVAGDFPRHPRLFNSMRSTPGLGRSPGGGNGNPLQHSCLENPMDRGAWWATVHVVTKSWTQLSDYHFTGHLPNKCQ